MTNRFLSSPEGQDWTRSNARVGTGLYESPVNAEATIPQEPMPERIDAGEYLDAISKINARRKTMAGRVNAMRSLTGRPANFSFGPLSGEQELKQRMGLRDEEIQDEILKRQRAAILKGEINNIDEQMQWYQTNGFDPHFAKTAREAAQSIFDQRGQERGFEIRETVEARGVRGAELKEEEAVRAQQRFKFAKAEARRKQEEYNDSQTTEKRNALISSRENELLAWAADKWWALKPEERTEAKREEIAREMSVHARDTNFQGFDDKGAPKTGRGDLDLVAPVPVELDEKSLIDTFRNEAKVVLKDADKEDEDFVTVPARDYYNTYKEGWDDAADDFVATGQYKDEIDAAIQADPNIAPKDKQAVFNKVVENLESLEKSVGRPTEPAERAYLKKERSHEKRLHGVTADLAGDIANKTRVYIEIMDEYLGGNIFLEGMTKGLREAMVWDRILTIMSYGPNPIHRIKVEELQGAVAGAADEAAAINEISLFSQAYRIPPDMARYLANPEEFKKRRF